MTTSLNGRLLASELGTVEGLPLAKPTINAYLRMKAAAKAAGIDIWIAQPIGAYRSYFVQGDMKVHPALYGLSTVSTVNIAAAGSSTHGLGNAIDIGSFGSAWGTAGAKRADWLILHAPEFGFFREFGERDPNHFHHDGFTAVDPIIDSASSGGLTPIVEDFMATLTEPEKQFVLNSLKDIVKGLAVANARDWTDAEAAQKGVLPNVVTAVNNTNALSQQIKAFPAPPTPTAISKAVWWEQTIERKNPDGTTVKVPAIQELADAKTNVLALLANGAINVDTLAAKLAPLIKFPAGTPQLTAAQIEDALRNVLAGTTLSPTP
jgi:hypothetical protein